MDKAIKRSYRLLQAEAVMTAVVIAMPIMTNFFRRLGMTQAQIGLSQAVFTIAVSILDIPTGWLADKFSRKWANAFGDLLVACGFLYYAFAGGFRDVIVSEIIIGVGLAFTSGADTPLLQAYCVWLKKKFSEENARIESWRPLAEAAGVIVGGIIGAYSLKWALVLTSVPFFAGALVSVCLIELGQRRQAVHKNPLKDMYAIGKYALHGHKPLAWAIFASAITREITHALIWLLTPILLLAGVPPIAVGTAWAANMLATNRGSVFARKRSDGMSDAQLLLLPVLLVSVASLGLAVNISVFTIGLYLAFGFARGWVAATMPVIVQERTPPDMQSTVHSVAASVGRLIYVPLVWGINAVADTSIRLALVVNTAVFLPVAIVVARHLRKKGE